MKLALLLTMLLSAICVPAHAGLYPVITDIRVIHNSGPYHNMYATLTPIDLPDADRPLPTSYKIGLGWREQAGPPMSILSSIHPGRCLNGIDCVGIVRNGETFSSAAMRVFNQGTNSGHIIITDYKSTCIGYIANPEYHGLWIHTQVPAGACVGAPPVNEWCNILEPAIVLEHGMVSFLDQAATTSAPVTVQCTAPMEIRLTFGSDVLMLGEGLSSQLRAEWPENGASYARLAPGENHGSVVSDLTITTPQPDSYERSTVMYVTYP